MSKEIVDQLFQDVANEPGYQLEIDLPSQEIRTGSGRVIHFEVDADRKNRLVNGFDDIGLTLLHQDKIKAYEAQRKPAAPWLFA